MCVINVTLKCCKKKINKMSKAYYYLLLLFLFLLTINICLCRKNYDDNNNNNNNNINNNNNNIDDVDADENDDNNLINENIFLNNSFNLNDNDINYNFINNNNINKNINNDTNIELHRCDPSNVDFNCTVEEFLKFARGPQTLPLSTALLVTILFVGIFVTGVIGNVIVCVVIVRHSTMHTATNYYLFSLAVSDLIFLMMGLPYELSLYWHQYPYNLGLGFCKIRALISEASTYVSVLTIVAFSMERFLAICHPLHLYTMSGFKRAVRIIAVLWIVSFLSAVPFAVFTTIDYISYPPDNSTIPDSAFCAMLENPNDFPLWELSTCVFFAVPMALIMVLYGRMGMRIRSRTRHTLALGVQQGSIHGESRQSQSRKAIIRMLAAVVITFFVCWAPFHAQRLMFLYARNWAHYQDLNTWLFSVAGWLYYVSCTINPILYNVMSHRYRVAFKETLCGKKRNGFQNNGFSRDQSSFRETTIAGTGGYENTHLIRVRSVIAAKRYSRYKDRERLTGGTNATISPLTNSPNKVTEPITTSAATVGTAAAAVTTTTTTNGTIQQTSTILSTTTTVPGIIIKTNSINGNNCAIGIGTGGSLSSGGSGNSIKWKDNRLNKNELLENEKLQMNTSIQQPTSAQTSTTSTISIAQTVQYQPQTQQTTTDMVVILGNPLNGRPKCYPTTINHLTNNNNNNNTNTNKHKIIDKDLFGEKNKNETCI